MNKEVSDEVRTHLKTLLDHFDLEDRAVRDRQIRKWRRLKLYWDGFQRIWYSEVAHDWRNYDETSSGSDDQDSYYDKPINIFRAYLETIIAALSVNVPGVKCYPADADNTLDSATAKAGDKISALVQKQNDSILLWIHALFIYVTEGMVAAYNYSDTDKKYGTYTKTETEDVEEDRYSCPNCEEQVDDLYSDENEYDPDARSCPKCEAMLSPEMQATPITIKRIIGNTDEAKTRQKIEVYGGLWVKVPNYAMTQKEIPYIILSDETHWTNVADLYDGLKGKTDWQQSIGYDSGGLYDPYERWGRLNPQYFGEYPLHTVTRRRCWFRPSSYHLLPEEGIRLLKKEFPNGVKVVYVNEEFAEASDENLDDHWTLTHNPLSDYLHHDPLGTLLTSGQDITNELISLILQTIEHGIPQTFVDTGVINTDQYRQEEAGPGKIFPIKVKTGQRAGDAFHEVKTASLSGEVMPFGNRVQELTQLVSGSLPSLMGGTATSGSKTASEYAQSRAQALQRLQTVWAMLSVWWKTINGKVIPAYIKDVLSEDQDERIVERDDSGNFVNVFIRLAELKGKIGTIELETSEQLPLTWEQRRATIMELMQLNNPVILEALSSPENFPILSEIIGLSDFVIPGEADRLKQYSEIEQLLVSAPIGDGEIDEMTGQPMEEPSVQIDIDIDNHQIEAAICREWLVSEAGRLAKIENPEGYKNVTLHFRMHVMQLMQAQMPADQPQEEGQQDGSGQQQQP